MIPLFAVYVSHDIDAPLLETLHSGYIGQGQKVEEFEHILRGYFQHEELVTLNSCTSALMLALRLAGVGPGDEVISTPMTCTATNMPILANGARITWADVNPFTGLIDPDDIKKKISPHTKAVICCDWGGTPCDLDALMDIGRRYNVKIIEDAAHSLGATYKDRRVGQVADYTCFSLQAIKHITTVDGGILCMKDSDDYRRAKLLRWYGIDREQKRQDFRCEENIEEWGYKFHMNDVNAVIGIYQWPYVPEILQKHRENAKYYEDYLEPVIQKPFTFYESQSSYWLYTLLLPHGQSVSAFIKWMKQNDISASRVHARNDTHTTFSGRNALHFHTKYGYDYPLPGVDEFYNRMVCIPVHWKLTEEERKRIVDRCNVFVL